MEEKVKSSLGELWSTFFAKSWPMWVGGILLGFLNVCLFLVRSPWGGSPSYINWGQNVYQSLNIINTPNLKGVLQHPYGLLGLMTILGAFVAALMAKEFSVRVPTVGGMVKGLVGGILMAVGATVGAGCTIGGFFSGWPSLNTGAIFLVLGFLGGAIVGFRYLLWESNNLPVMRKGKTYAFFAPKAKGFSMQPVLGIILFVGLLFSASQIFEGSKVLTWFAIIGLLLGLICQRSKFCIVRAFREPFMTGISAAPVGVFAALLVGIVGFTLIKYNGIGASSPEEAKALEMMFVKPNFWLRGIIGGFIFGMGMIVASGCAVGTLWRAGEGQVQLWFSALGFLVMAPISMKFIAPPIVNALPAWGKMKVFLPHSIGYGGAVLVILGIILLWYMFVKWNERTERFSVM